MAMITLDAPPVSRPTLVRSYWALMGMSAAMLALFLAAAVAETRMLDGANLWIKPAKFAASFVVLFASFALVAGRMSERLREGRAMWAVLIALTIGFLVEMIAIPGQAARGVRSHFNNDTEVATAIYAAMGFGSLTLVAAIAAMGWLAARDSGALMGPGLRAGVGLGFIGSAVLTLGVAGYLHSNGGHFVGLPVNGAAVPFLGWSGEVGDLRPAHFLSLHAMQALPLFGLWLDRRGVAAPGRTVAVVGVGYAVVTLAVFGQALMGLPLVRL